MASNVVTCVQCGREYAHVSTSRSGAKRCPACYRAPVITEAGEQKRVVSNNRIATQAGLPATLTLEQWLATLQDFSGRCAYCDDAPFALLEHFIPVSLGGGTTADNCVPACFACNHAKMKTRQVIPDETLERVRRYLSARATLIKATSSSA